MPWNPNWLEKVSDILEALARHAWLILIAAGFLLFAPGSWTDRLHLSGLVQAFGEWIGLVFLVAAVAVVLRVLVGTYRRITGWLKRRLLLVKKVERLAELDTHEKAVLREFFLQGKHTIVLPIDEAVAAGLLKQGIIYVVCTRRYYQMLWMRKEERILRETQPPDNALGGGHERIRSWTSIPSPRPKSE